MSIKKHILPAVIFIFGLGFLLGAQPVLADCKGLGESCYSAPECCSYYECNGSCCVPTGFGCAAGSQCCSGICFNNSCQDCLGDYVSCSSSWDCCSGICSGGICQSSHLTDCIFCAGDCLWQNQEKVCANGSKIYLPVSSGGCGSCTLTEAQPEHTISRCCSDDPTNCLYSCHKETAVSCGRCGTVEIDGVDVPLKCVKDESTFGQCSGGSSCTGSCSVNGNCGYGCFCSNDTCSPITGCFPNGTRCYGAGDCCSGICDAGGYCAPITGCFPNGTHCDGAGDCCSGICDAGGYCVGSEPFPCTCDPLVGATVCNGYMYFDSCYNLVCEGTKDCGTLTATLTANPTGMVVGQTSNLTVAVGGTATGDITFSNFSCGANGTAFNINYTTGAFSCSYTASGSKIAGVMVSRNGLSAFPIAGITVSDSLFASLSANPNQITTNQKSWLSLWVGGSATGDITYSSFNCGSGGTAGDINYYSGSFSCLYATAGTKIPSVVVSRAGLTATATTSISVSLLTLTATLLANPQSVGLGQLSNVTVSVGGSASGDTAFSNGSCGENGTFANFTKISDIEAAFTCSYSMVGGGVKTAGITVTRSEMSITPTTSITVLGADAPTAFSHSANTTTSITWTWTKPAGTVTKYQILDVSGSVVVDNIPVSACAGSSCSWKEPGLSTNSFYTRNAKACNQTVCSGSSNSASAYTSVQAVLSAQCTSITTSTLQVSAYSSTTAGYGFSNLAYGSSGLRFRRTGVDVWEQEQSYAFTGLASSTAYTLTVGPSRNGDGEEAGSFVSISCTTQTPAPIPSAPANLHSTGNTVSSIDWLWNPSAGATSYNIYVYSSWYDWRLIVSSTTTLAYTQTQWFYGGFTGLSANTSYGLAVAACNVSGCSGLSSGFAATSIETPSGISCSSIASTSMAVFVSGTFTHLDQGASGIKFRESATSRTRDFAPSTAWNLTGLAPNSAYHFYGQARNQDSDSTLETGPADCVTLPDVPRNVRRTAAGTTTYSGFPGYWYVDWQWDAPLGGAASYNVYTYSNYGFYAHLEAAGPDTSFRQTSYALSSGFCYLNPNSQPASQQIFLEACNVAEECSVPVVIANGPSSIENPDVITCSNASATGFTVRVRSSESAVRGRTNGAFTNLNLLNSGLRLLVKNPDGSAVSSGYNAGWVASGATSTYNYVSNSLCAGIEFLPFDWTVGGLSPDTSYTVCSQGRNQTANASVQGDYRPGPASWNCVACSTLPPPSTGFLQVMTPFLGVVKLNLISALSAIIQNNGMVKVAAMAGDAGTAADLVATSSPQASPVRVMTPFGVKAWRKIP